MQCTGISIFSYTSGQSGCKQTALNREYNTQLHVWCFVRHTCANSTLIDQMWAYWTQNSTEIEHQNNKSSYFCKGLYVGGVQAYIDWLWIQKKI